MSTESIELALATANKIGSAVSKKFPKHTMYVRRTETGDSGYIEIALRPEGAGYSQEISTSYADDFFLAAAKDQAALMDKAQRVLKDFREHFGTT